MDHRLRLLGRKLAERVAGIEGFGEGLRLDFVFESLDDDW